jgi:hypothetical protein
MHRLLFAFGFSICLSGCLAPMIHSDQLDFGGVIEDTTNKLLVMNVLRARDKAPLHFADIPQMRESMQQSFTFSWLNLFGTSRLPSNVRDSMITGTSIQKSPSFDINHLHSKEFITGISSPIDARIVKYFLDRGLDRRIVLLLFFSAVEIIETRSANGPVNTIRVTNSPRDAVEVIKRRKQVFRGTDELRCDTQSDFERYLKLLNTLRTFFAHSYRERRLLARGVAPGMADDSKNLQAFAALDQSKVQLVYDRERGTYSLYALSTDQKVAFCFYDDADPTTPTAPQFEVIDAGPGTAGDKRNCFQSVVEVEREETGTRAVPSPIFFPGAAFVQNASRYCGIYNRFTGTGPIPATKPGGYPRLELRLYIRSVGEIFQFLGDLLHYQDEVRKFVEDNRQAQHKLNTPITFGFCGDIPEPGCDDIFLRVDADPCNARFSLTYREREYYVGNFNPPGDLYPQGPGCRPDTSARKDHTLEILSVLHQLVGLHKSATDIRTTPSVNVLP